MKQLIPPDENFSVECTSGKMSPSQKLLAFCRDGNFYVKRLSDGRELLLRSDFFISMRFWWMDIKEQ